MMRRAALVLLCSIALIPSCTAFALRAVSGLFRQSDEPQSALPPHLLHMGLGHDTSWRDVFSRIGNSTRPTKLIVLLRHGQGTHNVAIDRYGSNAWNTFYRKLPLYIDAPLTPLGKQQARTASITLQRESQAGLALDQVVISPLDRALGTYMAAFAAHRAVPHVVLENARETIGAYTCDKRRSIADKKQEFPELDFRFVKSDADELWTEEHRESDSEIDARARAFLVELFARFSTAKAVAVVSHSLFSAACLRVLGHKAYALATAEFLPVLVEQAGAA